MSDEFAFRSIVELRTMLRTGETTSRALTEAALARLDSTGRALNAVVTMTTERALREADLADAELRAGIDRGPLHGIPYGAKDLLATADYPTTWGAEPFQDQQFEEDAAVVRRLEQAGAVLVAKLAMVELAGGFGYEQPDASLTGPGLNAWNPDRWAGGSSSGSGSAVGAGLVPFAIGTETWGSIHCPSAFNGITGLRPTPGRVSRDGAMALSWTMDKIGPMTRSADDAALVLAAIHGPDSRDGSTVRTPPLPVDGRSSGFRIGLLRGSVTGSSPGVAANMAAAIDVLREIASVEEIDLPDLPFDEAASMTIACEASSAFERFIEAGDSAHLRAPEVHTGMYHALTIPAVDYVAALRIRNLGASAMLTRLAGFDALIAPAMSHVAPPAAGSFEAYFAEHDGPSLSGMGNLVGLPSIAVPTGLEDGLPTSMEILGHWWAEPTVLAIASRFQALTDWHRLVPPPIEVRSTT